MLVDEQRNLVWSDVENPVIKADEVLDILNQHNSSPELVLELSFREKHEVEPTIITDLKESVDYWKNAINKFNN